MTTPTPRTPVRPGRGLKAALDTALAAGDIKEGEIVYAKDEDKLYMVEGGVFVPAGGGSSVVSIDDLSDVDTSTVAPTDGQVLTWDDAAGQWEPAAPTGGGGGNTLIGLDDTNIVSPQIGDLLQYKAAAATESVILSYDSGYDNDGGQGGSLTVSSTTGTTIDTTVKKFGASSLAVDTAAGAQVKYANSTAFELTGDFTIEAWVWLNANSSSSTNAFFMCAKRGLDYSTEHSYTWGYLPTGYTSTNPQSFIFIIGSGTGGTNFYSSTYVMPSQQWVHCAVTKTGGNLRFFADGVLISTAATALNCATTTGEFRVGNATDTSSAAQLFKLDELAITKSAKYTANFTPPGTLVPASGWENVAANAADGQVLTWVDANSQWEPADVPADAVESVAGKTGAVTLELLDNTDVGLPTAPPVLNPNTVVAITGEGTNGSTTFPNIATANSGDGTAVNQAQISTAQSKFYGSSMLFDGASDAVSIAHHDEQNLGANAFTIQFWVRFNTLTNGLSYAFAGKGGSASSNYGWSLWYSVSGTSIWWTRTSNGFSTNNTQFVLSSALQVNQWYHIRLTYSGTHNFLFVDGVNQGGAKVNSAFEWASTAALKIGARFDTNADSLNGYLNDFQIINGTSLNNSTTGFTPPTTALGSPSEVPPADGQVLTWVDANSQWEPAPLRIVGTAPTTTSDTGTAGELRFDASYLYVCIATDSWKRTALSTWTPPDTTVSLLLRMNGTNGSTSFTDESSYAHPVTASGSAQVSTSTVKFGTGALQGVGGISSTGYLSVPDHETLEFGSGNFTIELFVNFTSVASVQSLISKGYAGTANMSWALFRDASRGTLQLTVSVDGSADTRKEVTWAPSTGVWYHVAVTRSSGSLRFFVDGTQVEGTIASSETYFDGGGETRIGWAVNYGLDGFIDEVRLTKGVARYTSNFTPPAAEFPSP